MPRPYIFDQTLSLFALLFLLTLGLTACGDDEIKDGGPVTCSVGEQFNPILGNCVPIQSTNNSNVDGGTNNSTTVNNISPGDAGNNNVSPGDGGMTTADMAPGRCDEDVDQDNDGLSNACECELNTSPELADTDMDGIEDGVEDANQNCELDIGVETDPRRADSDNDGLSDFEEVNGPTDPLNPDADSDGVLDGAEVASGCMDPFSEDSDMDGIPDGVEDFNQDGEIGTCPNRMFDFACAQGESDPCSADSDGDGTPDSDEAQYRQCRPEDTQNLATANTVSNAAADYQLVLENAVTAAALTGPTGAEGHRFFNAGNNYTGFIVSLSPTNGQTNPAIITDEVLATAQAAFPGSQRRLSGRRITTHDSHAATVGSIVDLPVGTDLDTARDEVLASLLGTSSGTLAPANSSGIAGDTSETLFLYTVISRSASQYIVVGAFATLDDYQDSATETGFRVDDLVGGTAVASATETVVPECVSYKVTTKPQVDIIISIDGSGSMGEEQQALQNFAVDFTQLLANSNLDWRAAVTLPNCNSTMGLSMEAAMILQSHCGFGGFFGGTGDLEGQGFTSDPNTLEQNLNPGVFSMAGEAPMAAVLAASDKALPRTANDPRKFRPDAAVILISITDEEDAWWQDGGSWGNGQQITLPANQQNELETESQSWIDFFLKQEVGATLFGIVWATGDQCITGTACTMSADCGQFGTCIDTDSDGTADSCRTASAVAHAVSYVANETGGSVGSICQQDITNTLREIANAAAGIASGLRLRGTPLTPTIEVIHGDAQTGNINNVMRSRADGFDYDGIVNRVVFPGPNPPQTNDTVIIPYRRWDGSVFMCTDSSDCPSTQKLKCVDGECR